MYSTLGASRATAYELIGRSVEDEMQKRERENENGYDDIFAPRVTNYTSSGSNSSGGGNSSGSSGNSGGGGGSNKDPGVTNPEDDGKKVGRPQGEATDKQAYDKARNDAKKQMQGKG